MQRRLPLLGLGWSHYAVVVAGILTVLVIIWVMSRPVGESVGFWEIGYAERVAIPKFQVKYGFTWGIVPRRPAGEGQLGVTSVTPGGRFALVHVRPGDVPFTFNHSGYLRMYDALLDAERGRFASFGVLNVDDWNAYRWGNDRTIVVNPPDTDTAEDARWVQGELPSPDGRFALLRSRAEPSTWRLFVRDTNTGARVEMSPHASYAGPVWSPDGKHIAFTDSVQGASRCTLFSAAEGASEDLTPSLLRLEAVRQHLHPGDAVNCDVFGWVRSSGRLALTLRFYGSGGFRFRQDFLYDVAARTFVEVR